MSGLTASEEKAVREFIKAEQKKMDSERLGAYEKVNRWDMLNELYKQEIEEIRKLDNADMATAERKKQLKVNEGICHYIRDAAKQIRSAERLGK